MIITHYLQLAGVPPTLWPDAQASIDKARAAYGWSLGWMTLRKHFVRLFRAGKIADLLAWEDNHLTDKHPGLAGWDIAPMLNITSNGDNVEWRETPLGGRPDPDSWLNPDPTSDEYQRAVAACYWAPGAHPRSPEARKAWYRRNACEYAAWELGCPVGAGVQGWTDNGITVLRSGDAWQIRGTAKWLGPIRLKVYIGYEVGNIFAKPNGKWVQRWYPLPGYELRACVAWAVYPTWSKS